MTDPAKKVNQSFIGTNCPGLHTGSSKIITDIGVTHMESTYKAALDHINDVLNNIGEMGMHDHRIIIETILENAHPHLFKLIGIKFWLHTKLAEAGLDSIAVRNIICNHILANGFSRIWQSEYKDEKATIINEITQLLKKYQSLDEADEIMKTLISEIEQCKNEP